MTTIGFLHLETPQKKQDTQRTLDALASAISTHAPGILIGPEYLFVGPNMKLLTASEKSAILNELERMSRDADTILIPGTMVWEQDETYYNTAPVIYRGNTVQEVRKLSLRGLDKALCGNNNIAQIDRNYFRNAYVWGNNTPLVDKYLQSNTVQVAGKTVLVEICDDHAFAVEKAEFPKIADVQVIVSCQGNHHFSSPRSRLGLKDGGLLIECNGAYPSSFVARVQGDGLRRIWVSEKGIYQGVGILNYEF